MRKMKNSGKICCNLWKEKSGKKYQKWKNFGKSLKSG